ncbi:Protein of uncharacterised function (DUF3618) [Stutzerimonas stutzeri]|uniref:DUF3618 domain-containing protein n=1 Tax=Stutzerimonas stutzeri subgroup TaxID=578833 RepID=UPI000C6E92F1|nr:MULTISPECIES: DUF3618 domain-containing protein [Stutzerimonas stutzeri subgroup]MCQ2047491.1 DUF3618 domain-containing protein [Stutzerimonas kunmingensis]PKR28937.1 hypothetical protein CXK90_01245 [Stutzerimonas stutzeri]QQC12911.1 DUF3618 domain-containing protein [Stutzerimonas stutzeri]VEI35991.1 Protein of uncharacterised function (DUF3618) [Stutzerimonas stutzeri]
MSTHNQVDVEAQKDPDTLEREIDQQRAEIGNIVHALESKLSPGQMIDTALGYAKGGGGEFLHNLTDTVKANPVPTLLTSVGLVWLMAGQNRRSDYSDSASTGPSMTDKLAAKASGLKQQGTGIKEKAAQMSHSASSSLGNARHRVGDSSRHAAESLRHTADRARGGFTQLLNEQPLALGAMGIALGALLAASVPPTRREDELMGQKSDELTGKIKDKAREGYAMASAEGEQLAGQVKHDLERDHGQPASRPH